MHHKDASYYCLCCGWFDLPWSDPFTLKWWSKNIPSKYRFIEYRLNLSHYLFTHIVSFPSTPNKCPQNVRSDPLYPKWLYRLYCKTMYTIHCINITVFGRHRKCVNYGQFDHRVKKSAKWQFGLHLLSILTYRPKTQVKIISTFGLARLHHDMLCRLFTHCSRYTIGFWNCNFDV